LRFHRKSYHSLIETDIYLLWLQFWHCACLASKFERHLLATSPMRSA
jgi:hypothetical protein